MLNPLLVILCQKNLFNTMQLGATSTDRLQLKEGIRFSYAVSLSFRR